ncbi:MAG TPA: Rieske (2Fe-2S) protein [Eoetvoesiella sp.]|uniref:Rieske (2Fe-2S) protein n=1 Tax=Eoetvoesiella sp. TaxID=1966355 RepID=UPI002BC2658E|nr:Rieske (2Fe-2S) protein [Eoetvoesiella sp.]HWK62669.1 Rieske (2Fe-2S) protein [Eoetvoesiella sp.]
MNTTSQTPSTDSLQDFVETIPTNELPPGSLKRFVAGNRAIALANIDGNIHAFEDRCLHWGVRLSDGCLEENVVRCRAHGWKHDLVKGEVAASEPPGDEGRPLVTFTTQIRDGFIWVGTTPQRRP